MIYKTERLTQKPSRYRQQSKAGSVAHAGLQRSSTISQSLVSAIPDSLEFHEAATLPLSVTLAAVALYQKNHLDLPLPRARSSERRQEEAEEEHTILIINGASSIGALAIQLATASGVRVISTASSNEVSFVQSLGASIVVDDSDPSTAHAELASAILVPKPAQLLGIFDTRSTEASFAHIDALLQDISQSPRVCAVRPPGSPPKVFVPTVGKFGREQRPVSFFADQRVISTFPSLSALLMLHLFQQSPRQSTGLPTRTSALPSGAISFPEPWRVGGCVSLPDGQDRLRLASPKGMALWA